MKFQYKIKRICFLKSVNNIISFLVESFHPIYELDKVFTNIHMALISRQSCSHVKASIVLMRVDHLFIYNYIKSILNIILRPIILVRMGFEPESYYLCV